ncbi:MAG: SRPBCC family protein [Saprospiraceae bacterium]
MRPFLAILFLTIGSFLTLAILGPDIISFQRHIQIDASQHRVFDEFKYLGNFNNWSPWAILDPQMSSSVKGVDAAVGATYTWEGNDQVGAGTMTIEQIQPDSIVLLQLHFVKPWPIEGHYKLSVDSLPADSSNLTWHFEVEIPFYQRPIMYFVDLEKSLSKDLETGLGNLRKNCETKKSKKNQVN